MLKYTVDSEINLSLPNPPVDSHKLFNLIKKSPRLGEFLPWISLIKAAADEEIFLKQCNEGWINGKSLNLIIHYRNQVAGVISLNHIYECHADIGYWLGKDFEGYGIMSRSVQGLIKLIKEDYPQIKRLELLADVDNTKSNNVARRLNFTHEATLKNRLIHSDGSIHNANLYAYWFFVKKD